MFTKRFLLDALERTLATFVQAAAGMLVVVGLDDWRTALGASAIAGALAVAKSLAGSQIGVKSSASTLPRSASQPPV
jgi:hypothetical protein